MEIKVNGKVIKNKEDIKYILKRKDNQRKMFLGERLTKADIDEVTS